MQLVRLLLQTAGYRKAVSWRVRVEKKINCGAETKPITVVGSKAWCCYLKIKPGDNNTAHFCSLLMPAGYRGEVVYESIKDIEERVNFAWRTGFEGEVVPMDETELTGTNVSAEETTRRNGVSPHPFGNGVVPPMESASAPQAEAPAAPVVPPPMSASAPQPQVSAAPVVPPPMSASAPQAEAPAAPATLVSPELNKGDDGDEDARGTEMRGWSQDPDNLRLTLLAIHEAGKEGKTTNQEFFVFALIDKLGWQGMRRRQIGGVLTQLVRQGYITAIRRGSQKLGYELTPQGQQLIHGLLPPSEVGAPSTDRQPPTVKPATAVSPTDPAGLMLALSKIAEETTTAYKKLQENRARRAQLLAELDQLDAAAKQLSQVVNNPEVQSLLQRLAHLTGSPAGGGG